jgi:MFS family permease
MRVRFGGLWRHRDFVWLWSGQTISVFGSLTTRVALPLTAIVYLDAPAYQVALLTSVDVLAGILVGLYAGVLVDRMPRRPLMIGADVGRAALLGSVPLAALFGVLGMPQLFVVKFAAGVLTVLFDVAYQSYLPTLVSKDELVEGNSKLTASASVAEFGAFSASGWLTQLITAPGAILVDAVSFVASAASLLGIRAEEAPPRPAQEHEDVRTEIGDGLRAVWRDPVLRALAASVMAFGGASGLIGGVILFYLNRDLGFSPGVLGLTFGVGGVTALGGSLVAGRARERFGPGGAAALGMAFGALGILPMLAVTEASAFALALLVLQQVVSDPGWTVYEINEVSLRQAVTPAPLLGRVNGAMRFSLLVATLAGSVLAAGIAAVLGARAVLAIGAAVTFAGAAAVYFSPARRAAVQVGEPVEPATAS